MSSNPYETNFSDLTRATETSSGLDLDTKETMLSLGRWQMFFAVLGAILSGLILLMMFGQMLNVGLGANGAAAIPAVGGTAVMLILMGLFYILPTIRLFQATAAIRKFRTDQASLRTVMETQRSFWRTIGVLAIVGISIYVVVIFFMLSVAAFSMRF
jgi:hypothetical protein